MHSTKYTNVRRRRQGHSEPRSASVEKARSASSSRRAEGAADSGRLVHVPYLTAPPQIQVYPRLLKTHIPAEPHPLYFHPTPVRGPIRSFSARSRSRMLQRLAMIDYTALGPAQWVTLTYHESYPVSHDLVQRDIDTWLKAIERLQPDMRYIRRLDWQRRGAPHHHLIIWFPDYYHAKWLAEARIQMAAEWHRIAAPHSIHHARHGARIKEVNSLRGLVSYVSKYAAKVDQPGDHAYEGRRWAASRRLPCKPQIEASVSLTEMHELRRLCRRWLRSQHRRSRPFPTLFHGGVGFHLYIAGTIGADLVSAAAIIAEGKHAAVHW